MGGGASCAKNSREARLRSKLTCDDLKTYCMCGVFNPRRVKNVPLGERILQPVFFRQPSKRAPVFSRFPCSARDIPAVLLQ